MATKDLESLRRAAEGATPESVEAATSFLRAANNELRGVLAARALGWFARGMALVDREQVVEALSASEGYEAVLPLIEELVLEDAQRSPMVRARLRGIRRKGEVLEAEGGSVGTAEAAEILGGISKQAVDKRRERRTILALPRGGGETAFPLWQFDEGTRDGLLPGLARVLRSFSVEKPLDAGRVGDCSRPTPGSGGRGLWMRSGKGRPKPRHGPPGPTVCTARSSWVWPP